MTKGDIDALVWEAPGPGSWTPDAAHTPKPVTKHLADAVPDSLTAGFAEWMRRYGLLLDHLKQVTINGFAYGTGKLAPEAEFPARMEAAAETFATKRWRDDLRRWDEEVKPRTIATHRALAKVDLAAADDDELVAHLEVCRENHRTMVKQHHQFDGAAMIPLGDFLVRAMGWTGLASGELLGLFKGASPVSAGDCEELSAVVTALSADPAARQLVEDGSVDAAQVLASLRSTGGKVGPAVEDWLSVVGHRIIDGFDVCAPTAIEQPDCLVMQLRAALSGPADRRAGVAEERARIRKLVPAEHRDEFDEALDEALLTYRLRDERGVYSDITACGLVRRAMLGVGARLHQRGVLADPELAIEASVDELIGLLRGEAEPSNDELTARAEFRSRYSVRDIPQRLGDPPAPPPPLELLPPPLNRLMSAFMVVIRHLFEPAEASDDGDASVVRGIAASEGVHRGRARVVATVDDLATLEEGDVLVTITTSEAFNCAIGLVSAIVTDAGGLLSHAAIIAREYRIPAVVGTNEATTRIPDGAVIEVDGTAGEVRILS